MSCLRQNLNNIYVTSDNMNNLHGVSVYFERGNKQMHIGMHWEGDGWCLQQTDETGFRTQHLSEGEAWKIIHGLYRSLRIDSWIPIRVLRYPEDRILPWDND